MFNRADHILEFISRSFTAFKKRFSDPTGRKTEIKKLKEELYASEKEVTELSSKVRDLQTEVEVIQSQHDQLATELMIQELAANTDDLTGANNRKSFNSFLENIGKEVDERGFTGKGCVVAIDLDRFKAVNDTYGHAAGDEVLKAVVQRLQKVNLVSAEITLYRIGGDEFVLVVLDKRHDNDRRKLSSEDPNLYSQVRSGKERRQMPFEVYVQGAIREAIAEAASKSVSVKLQNGKEVEVDFGISEGIGHFDSVTKPAMLDALREADTQAYRKKSGLEDFLEAYGQMSDESREFLDRVLSLRVNENAKGGYEFDREIGFNALAQAPQFRELVSSLSERSLRWLYPELGNLKSQSGSELGR